MKVFENKKTSLLKEKESAETADYRELVLLCFNKPVKKAQTYKEMKAFFDLLEVFEEPKEKYEITLELAKVLKQEVEEMSWAIRHKDILEFVEYTISI